MFAAARVLSRVAPAPRTLIQRRMASSSNAKADGNAFIREREAVKKHASESAGTFLPLPRRDLCYHADGGE